MCSGIYYNILLLYIKLSLNVKMYGKVGKVVVDCVTGTPQQSLRLTDFDTTLAFPTRLGGESQCQNRPPFSQSMSLRSSVLLPTQNA